MRTYTCVYFGAALVAMFAMPVVTRVARALHIVDAPGVRRVHGSPVPRLGGVPIVLAMLALTVPVLFLDNTIGRAFRRVHTQVLVLLISGLFIFIVGLIDDLRGLRARMKLASQIAAAATVCAFGIRMDSEITVGWFTVELGLLAWPITIVWIVGITNAINLIDGLDGLAGGIASVTCGVIAIFALYNGQPVMGVLMLALLGSLTGFLFFNFNPAKIFMGDCGTLFVGFMLAASSVLCAVKSATLVGLALPALALGLPIFDTVFSILRRVLERRSIFSPDSNHIHHRLLQMGLRQRHAVVVMYAVTLICAGLGMFMMVVRDINATAVFAGVLVLLLITFRIVGAVRLRDSLTVLRHNLTLARQAKEEKRHFEDAELRMREARTLGDWWEGLCAAAEKMDFSWLKMLLESSGSTTRRALWRRPTGGASCPQIVTTIPIGQWTSGTLCRIDAGVMVNGSLESAGRRIALFGRLIDEHTPINLLGNHPDTGDPGTGPAIAARPSARPATP